jgi:hypothetical protein
MVYRRYCIILIICIFFTATFAQKEPLPVLRHYDIKEIGRIPAEIVISPDYQTIIEFDKMSIETASSGRADQITVELTEHMIFLRANKNVVTTDLTVIVNGKVAIFTLRSDPTSSAARRYVIIDR